MVRTQYGFQNVCEIKCCYKHTENTMVCNQVFCMTYDRLTIILLSTVTPFNQLWHTSQLYLMVKYGDHSMVALNDKQNITKCIQDSLVRNFHLAAVHALDMEAMSYILIPHPTIFYTTCISHLNPAPNRG